MPQPTLATMNEVATEITDAINNYAKNFDKIGVKAIVEDQFDRNKKLPVRASAFNKCPKLASALSRGLVVEEFDDRTYYVFLLAHYAAMMAKVAIRDAFREWKIGRRWHWAVTTETKTEYQDKISATIDVLLIRKNHPDGEVKIPVEVKKTAKLRLSHVWQTICYMKALDTDGGIILTLFSGIATTFATWVVYRAEGGYRLFLGNTPMVIEGLPEVFTDEEFYDMLSNHIAWDLYTSDELLDEAAPYDDLFSEPCARTFEPPDVYKRNGPWGKVGDNKPGSGVVSDLCPLYGRCHRAELKEAGFPDEVNPKVLAVVTVEGVHKLKEYGDE